MKAIRKRPGVGPEIVDIQDEEQIYAELGSLVTRWEVARGMVILYDSWWREHGKPRNEILCGQELGGTVFLVGNSENGLTDLTNIDGVLYAFFLTVRYGRADRANNVWNCRRCGYLHQFEADGPFENGWNLCPVCGGWLLKPTRPEGEGNADGRQ